MNSVQLVLSGSLAILHIPEGMKPAHGTGLDGSTQVRSLYVGASPELPGHHAVQDKHGNAIAATRDALLAAVREISPDFDIVATRKITGI